MLSQDEIERRVLAAQDLLPFDPKERLTSLGLMDCPVCDQETLLAEHLDDFGIGIASGTCFVCGYHRGHAVVDQEAMRHMWFNKWMHEQPITDGGARSEVGGRLVGSPRRGMPKACSSPSMVWAGVRGEFWS